MTKDNPLALPPPPAFAYGNRDWLDDSLHTAWRLQMDVRGQDAKGKLIDQLPPFVEELRDRPLADCINPLLFMRGPASAWMALGKPGTRGPDNNICADVTQLKPAPMGMFFDPEFSFKAAKGKQEARYEVDRNFTSPDDHMPTLPHNYPLIPLAIRPVRSRTHVGQDGGDVVLDDSREKKGGGSSGKLYCVFPRCRMPADSLGVASNPSTMYMHVLVDHLGLWPTCPKCNKRLKRMEKCWADHVEDCKGSPTKGGNHQDKGVEMYGFVSEEEWLVHGRTRAEFGNAAWDRLEKQAKDRLTTHQMIGKADGHNRSKASVGRPPAKETEAEELSSGSTVGSPPPRSGESSSEEE